MTNFYYFKRAFIPFAVFIIVFHITKGLFDVDFSNITEVGELIVKGIIGGIITGIIMGILNIFFKINTLRK